MLRKLAALVLCGIPAAAQYEGPKEPLSNAAYRGDVAKVTTLLAGGADPNVRDEDGLTPLIRAATVVRPPDFSGGDGDGVVRALLKKGADVNARDRAGRTALLAAVSGVASEYKVIGADESMARLLLANGADINAQDNDGVSPLLKVATLWADQPKFIEFLLSKGANVNARLKDGRTALMLAARLGKEDRIPMMLKHGAAINAQANHGSTALMIAAGIQWDEQSASIMKLLVSKGANVNLRDQHGETAADRAADAGYLDRAIMLLDMGTKANGGRDAFLAAARNRALWRAIAAGSVAAAKTLLDQGASPDYRDAQGKTLLMIAAANEYSADKVKLLLAHGAAVNIADPEGTTALMAAADAHGPECVKALLDAGADPNATDKDGNTVLIRAAAAKHSFEEDRRPLIHFLLEKGADPNRRNSKGVTALMLTAQAGSPAMEQILDRRAKVDVRDDDGNTALLYATRFFAGGGNKRAGWELLEHGADVNAANRFGETPLILASRQYEADGAGLLIDRGANINERTKTGRTALMQAIDGPEQFDNDQHIVYSPRIAELLIAKGADVNAHDESGDTALKIASRRGYKEMADRLRKAGAKE